jgi:hypothetical protein
MSEHSGPDHGERAADVDPGNHVSPTPRGSTTGSTSSPLGARQHTRPGFRGLLTAVYHVAVGAVCAVEASRLARPTCDGHHLVDRGGMTDRAHWRSPNRPVAEVSCTGSTPVRRTVRATAVRGPAR